jgi:hypothetical protein
MRVIYAGYSQQQFGAFNKWCSELDAANNPYIPVEPKKSTFKPKFDLPQIATYEGVFPAGFWDQCKRHVKA